MADTAEHDYVPHVAPRLRFRHDVKDETATARALFLNSGIHPENDDISRELWMTIIGETVGKLMRCTNKLALAQDPESRRQWKDEGYHEIVVATSLLSRLAEVWEAKP